MRRSSRAPAPADPSWSRRRSSSGIRVARALAIELAETSLMSSIVTVGVPMRSYFGAHRTCLRQVQHRVQQHRRVAARQHESDRGSARFWITCGHRNCIVLFHSWYATGASAIGVPGWPESAAWTASIASVRIRVHAQEIELRLVLRVESLSPASSSHFPPASLARLSATAASNVSNDFSNDFTPSGEQRVR